MTTVAELVVRADPDAWRGVGFVVDGEGCVTLGGIRLKIEPGGQMSWLLAGDGSETDIDGLTTRWLAEDAVLPVAVAHPNGVRSIDHLVVNTPDLEQTCAAIEAATMAPLKRIREAGAMRQGFHRLGELIVEVVTYPGIAATRAEFWGLALNAVDLDEMFATYGP
jgi:hypothetical protein